MIPIIQMTANQCYRIYLLDGSITGKTRTVCLDKNYIFKSACHSIKTFKKKKNPFHKTNLLEYISENIASN